MSTPAIMKMVSEKRTALATQKRAVELLEAELSGMEAILALIPQTPLPAVRQPEGVERATAPTAAPRSSGGRQPGAISNKWKRHLLALDDAHASFNLDEVIELVAERESRTMRPSEVKRLFDKYVEQGHVQQEGDAYIVPETVVQKFKSSLRDAGDDTPDEDEIASDLANKDQKLSKNPEATDYDLDDDVPFEPDNSKRGGYDLDDDIPF